MDYDQHFPCAHLLRAVRIAFDLRKILLAVAALLALAAGEMIAARLPFTPEQWNAPLLQFPEGANTSGLLDRLPASSPENPPAWVEALAGPATAFLLPFRSIVNPIADLLDGAITLRETAFAVFRLLWALLVWAIFGGAITRLAAVRFARDQATGLRGALGFSARRFLSFFSAPLLPLTGLIVLWLICALAGLIGRIPYAGPVLVGALWVVPLVLSFLMAIILGGFVAGWPLMYAAISTEGSDAFDGFSRSFSYVFSRPLRYAGYLLATAVLAAAAVPLVSLLFSLIAFLAAWSVATGMGGGAVERLHHFVPEATALFPPPTGDGASETAAPELGARVASFWLWLLVWMKSGFAVSLFWSAVTIVYFLMRRADDAAELDEVYLPDESEQDDLLPLVGTAASEQPVVERPHAPTPREGEASGDRRDESEED